MEKVDLINMTPLHSIQRLQPWLREQEQDIRLEPEAVGWAGLGNDVKAFAKGVLEHAQDGRLIARHSFSGLSAFLHPNAVLKSGFRKVLQIHEASKDTLALGYGLAWLGDMANSALLGISGGAAATLGCALFPIFGPGHSVFNFFSNGIGEGDWDVVRAVEAAVFFEDLMAMKHFSEGIGAMAMAPLVLEAGVLSEAIETNRHLGDILSDTFGTYVEFLANRLVGYDPNNPVAGDNWATVMGNVLALGLGFGMGKGATTKAGQAHGKGAAAKTGNAGGMGTTVEATRVTERSEGASRETGIRDGEVRVEKNPETKEPAEAGTDMPRADLVQIAIANNPLEQLRDILFNEALMDPQESSVTPDPRRQAFREMMDILEGMATHDQKIGAEYVKTHTLDWPGRVKEFRPQSIRSLYEAPAALAELVTSLNLRALELDLMVINHLAQTTKWKNVEFLDLSREFLGTPDQRRDFAHRRWLHQEIKDKYWEPGLNDLGAMIFSQSTHWKNITHLNLEGNFIGLAGARYFAKSPHWKNVKVLNMKFGIDSEGAYCIYTSPNWPNLELFEFGLPNQVYLNP